jgi:putative phage-type endonuclease
MQQQIKIYDFDQRSPEWYKIREGKITASPIINILGKDTIATTKNAINNLAMKLASEQVFGMIEDDYVSFDMQRGIDLEPSALSVLADILSVDFIDLSKVGFVEYSEHIGCSPDGLTSTNCIAEVKCPKPDVFFRLCIEKEIDKKYYAQMQHQIMCANGVGGYFLSYCVHQGKEYHYAQFVERDEAMIQLIKSRCEDVIGLKIGYVDQLINVKKNDGINLITEPTYIAVHEQCAIIYDSI